MHRRKRKILTCLLLALLAAAGMLWYVNASLRPVLEGLASARVESATARAMNEAILEVLGTDAAGELLLSAEGLWAIMDIESRGMIRGEERGIELDGVEEGRLRPLRRLSPPEGGESFPLSPRPEQIDENGHMNNAAYFDALEPMLPADLQGRCPRVICIDYEHEIPAGCSAAVRVVREGESCWFEGSMGDKACFRLREDFAV